MNKKIYILFFALMLVGSAFGQFVGRDNLSVALFYIQKNEIDSAKKYIDLASEDPVLKEEAKTWYYKGFVYKELYKSKEKENPTSPLRITSIQSFEKMLSLEGKEAFEQSTAKFLRYEATTLYNDAARMLVPESYQTAISNYNLFRETMLIIDANTDLENRDIQFKLALASMLNTSGKEAGKETDSTIRYKVEKLYNEVLAIDSNNATSNYNLGILYYNEAAEVINNMDYDTDIIKLNDAQDYCVAIFLKSLPFMQKSYELGYKKEETLTGLSNIYYGLNDMEKSNFYKKELEELRGGTNESEEEK